MTFIYILCVVVLIAALATAGPNSGGCEHTWHSKPGRYKPPGLWGRGGTPMYHVCIKCGAEGKCDNGFNMPTEHDNPRYRCTTCNTEHDGI